MTLTQAERDVVAGVSGRRRRDGRNDGVGDIFALHCCCMPFQAIPWWWRRRKCSITSIYDTYLKSPLGDVVACSPPLLRLAQHLLGVTFHLPVSA